MLNACRAQMEKEFRRMAVRLASGEDVPDKDIWWLRGWYACLKQFLDSPKTADARIKRNRSKE